MRRHRTTTAALLVAASLALTGCSTDSSNQATPEPAATVTVTAPPEPEPLTEGETVAQCTLAVSESAPGWDDWNINLGKWKDDPRTPAVCKTLDNLAYHGAYLDGLELAAACGTPEALPGRC